MSRLVVVSNRVAPVKEGEPTAGGLAMAVLAALRETGGLWFGWSGEVVDDPQPTPRQVRSGRLTYATIDLDRQDFEEYYNGFANSTLWPLFHYRLDLAGFRRHTLEGYRRVNGLFAERLFPLLRRDDIVWVHDYHLVPLGQQLRDRGSGHRLGFFLHTPFPAPEILTVLPGHDQLVRDLCSYDLIGLQTDRDVQALCRYLTELAGGERLDGGRMRVFGRTLRIGAFPISIDTADIEADAPGAGRTRNAVRLRDSLVGRRLIIGVDRLDYSKGLPQRFAAFELLLAGYPDWRGQVTFMQIAPPTRTEIAEYQEIRRQLEGLAGHVNGTYAEFDWVPIRYLNKSFSRRALLGFYRLSRVGLVTPLRDGMNLVAKEYVAAQDPGDPGVLVLSTFAGAAAELTSALIVNPFDPEGVADTLARALAMSPEERRDRHAAAMEVLRSNDVNTWRRQFVDALRAAA